MNVFVYWLTSILLVPSLAFGQELVQRTSKAKFKHFAAEQGLSQSTVLCIEQDAQGFMWFGTRDGLNRFDGYEIITYRHNERDSMSISDNWINTIFRDSDNNLWIGTENGLNLYKAEHDGFRRFYHQKNDPHSISGNIIHDISENSVKQLLVGTENGLDTFIRKEGKFKSTFNLEEFEEISVRSILTDYQNNLWLTTSTGIFRCNANSASFESISIEKMNATNVGRPVCLYQDKMQKIWLGYDQGLALFDEQDNCFKPYGKENNIEVNAVVRVIHEDRNGHLWAGAYDGLYMLDFERKNYQKLVHNPNAPFSLSQNSIHSLCEDAEGNLWFGTWAGGVNYLDHSFGAFNTYLSETFNKDLSSGAVSSFAEDEIGNIWIGTESGGLIYWNRHINTFQGFTHDASNPGSLSVNHVKALLIDHYNKLWVGTHDGGLNLVDLNEKQYLFKDLRSLYNLDSDRIICLFEDSDSNIWIGTSSAGLKLYDRKSDIIKSIDFSDRARSETIYAMHEDNNGRLLIGGSHGLIKLNRYTFEVERLANRNVILEDAKVYSIHEDSDQNVWIGTDAVGLYFYSNERDSVARYGDIDELSNEVIYGILEDEDEKLWLSTNNGLIKLNLPSGEVKRYDLYNGLQSNEFNHGAYIKTSRNEMIFGGSRGFNIFRPKSIVSNKFVPPVIITGVKLKNQPLNINKFSNSPTGRRNETPNLVLEYDQNIIDFDFVALSYSQPRKNQYAYILEGFDEDWNYVGNRRSATYTNLNPGAYLFKVRASNADLAWNMQGDKIWVTILPPLWKTWWAYLIYTIIAMAITFAIRKFTLLRLQDKNALKFERLQKEKIEEINNMKLQFFTNISHEFRTPLTLILGPLQQIASSKEGKTYFNDMLQIMMRNATVLLKLVNQLMDFRKIESGKLDIRVCKTNIIEFVHEIVLAFQEHAKSRNIKYRLSSADYAIEAYVDLNLMEDVLFNLLSNAFKFTQDGGNITVKVAVVEDSRVISRSWNNENQSALEKAVEIKVIDNGRGISEMSQAKIFDRFFQIENLGTHNQIGTGIGLSLTKSLVERHGGSISVESIEGNGSTFTIHLPIGSTHFSSSEIVDSKSNQPYITKYPISGIGDQYKESVSDESTLPYDQPEENKPVILVVEDNDQIRVFVKKCLSDKYTVYEANDGEQGLATALSIVPDLVITDLIMPKLDGIELCGHIRKDIKTSHIPVILLTARTSDMYKREGLTNGADDYITKPFNHEILLLKVNNLIASRRLMREKFKRDLVLQPKELTVTSVDDKFLQKAIGIVEDRISDQELGVTTFTYEFGISRTVLYKKVKALTGQSITEFIRNIRLKRAGQLLLKSDFQISEIAYKVGFNDLKYFRKCFKKMFKQTPTAYRNRNLNS